MIIRHASSMNGCSVCEKPAPRLSCSRKWTGCAKHDGEDERGFERVAGGRELLHVPARVGKDRAECLQTANVTARNLAGVLQETCVLLNEKQTRHLLVFFCCAVGIKAVWSCPVPLACTVGHQIVKLQKCPMCCHPAAEV